MSKISQTHAELEEQAYEYGFNSLQEALDTGAYEVIYGPYRAYLDKKDGQAEAHKAWLEEKKVLVGDLRNLLIGMHASGRSDSTDYAIVEHALEFITKGEQ